MCNKNACTFLLIFINFSIIIFYNLIVFGCVIMKNYNVNNLIYFVNSSFKNKSYNLTLKLLEELIKRDKTFYKAYCLLGYIIFIKSENNKKN